MAGGRREEGRGRRRREEIEIERRLEGVKKWEDEGLVARRFGRRERRQVGGMGTRKMRIMKESTGGEERMRV